MSMQRKYSSHAKTRQDGLTIVEVLITIVIAAILIAGLGGVIDATLAASEAGNRRNDALRDLRFAMQRMVTAVRGTDLVLVPQRENPASAWRESVREQFVPPPAGLENDTAALAVALDVTLDRNADGQFDADNDGDGRVNEDPGSDMNDDNEAGVLGIDDDGDGLIDEGDANVNVRSDDDDEDADNGGTRDEDPVDGIDNDGDGRVDEDAGADHNGDGAPGVAGVDDDGDGTTDPGSASDDDEDSVSDEDWIDVVAFYLDGDTLVERSPTIAPVDGRDTQVHIIADHVTAFRVERITTGGRAELIDLTLSVQPPGAAVATLNTRVRVGGRR